MTTNTFNGKTTVYYSAVETAQLIRAALKSEFPSMKFSVKTSQYAGGASVNVKWSDGPTEDMVELVAKQFAGSTFDGSIDLKSSIERVNEAGQSVRYGADFVFCSRTISSSIAEKALDAVRRRFENSFEGVSVLASAFGATLTQNADMIYPESHLSLLQEWRKIAASMLPSGVVVKVKGCC